MLLILLVIQFAVWANAEASRTPRPRRRWPPPASRAAPPPPASSGRSQVISQIGSSVLVGPQVSVTMTPADVTVTVTGTAERVVPLPGLSFPVSVTVTGPVEQFVPATAQG